MGFSIEKLRKEGIEYGYFTQSNGEKSARAD